MAVRDGRRPAQRSGLELPARQIEFIDPLELCRGRSLGVVRAQAGAWARDQRKPRPTVAALLLGGPENGGFVGAIAVKIAGDGFVASLTELNHAVGGVDLSVAVGVDDPLAVAEDGNFFDAVAVKVADDR